MKNFITLILVVSTFYLAGCASTQHSAEAVSKKSAIESVLAQRARLYAKDEGAALLNRQHVAELLAIDVKGCPPDFRSAWFDYLVTVQNLHTRIERVSLLASGIGKPVDGLPSLIKFAASNEALGHYLLGTLDKVDDAWSKLDRVAMNYGVMPER